MNTLMYEHPLTAEHLRVVREVVKYNVVGPIGKALACGDIGAYNHLWLNFLGEASAHEFRCVVQVLGR
jgi:hypothetical protein